jgi:hypothetical protein
MLRDVLHAVSLSPTLYWQRVVALWQVRVSC